MMRHDGRVLVAFLALGLLVAGALGAAAQDARGIMERMDANSRAQNNSVFSIMQIATCKFGISGGKVKCAVKPTIKKIESASVNTGAGGRASNINLAPLWSFIWPSVSSRTKGRPFSSTTAWSLEFRPPFVRPIRRGTSPF